MWTAQNTRSATVGTRHSHTNRTQAGLNARGGSYGRLDCFRSVQRARRRPMSGPSAFGTNPYVSKTPVVGRVVAVLRGVTDRRGLFLTEYRSRAVPAGEIHELM